MTGDIIEYPFSSQSLPIHLKILFIYETGGSIWHADPVKHNRECFHGPEREGRKKT
jgi:hypothetical protein